MYNGTPKYVIILGLEKPSTTSIWNEVFPVTVVSKQAVLIRFHPEQKLPALMLARICRIVTPTTSWCITWSPSLTARFTQVT